MISITVKVFLRLSILSFSPVYIRVCFRRLISFLRQNKYVKEQNKKWSKRKKAEQKWKSSLKIKISMQQMHKVQNNKKQTDKKEQQKVNAKYKWSETVVLGSNNFGLTAFNSYFYDISTQHPINNNLGFCKMFSWALCHLNMKCLTFRNSISRGRKTSWRLVNTRVVKQEHPDVALICSKPVKEPDLGRSRLNQWKQSRACKRKYNYPFLWKPSSATHHFWRKLIRRK